MTTEDKPLCAAILFHETRVDPAEYCDEEAVEGSEYCEDHGGEEEEPWERDTYKERLEDSFMYSATEHSDLL